jgi:serine/threonine-protein kinase
MSALPNPVGEPKDGAPVEPTQAELRGGTSSESDPADTVCDPDQTAAWMSSELGPTLFVDALSLPATEPSGVPDHEAGLPMRVAGYEILGMLGRGGMGVVYRARQPGLKRVVALKMIVGGVHASNDDITRFRTEAEAVARLQHPNIVQIYEVGEEEGRPYFSLEFVDGQSLAKRTAGAPQPPRTAARLVQTLAHAVEYAHRNGVVHRDLKPANILLTPDGVPKITDFGLAKRLEDDSNQTRSGSILGTPSYMAPEQAAGRTRDVGPRSDVYALGAILYELLTGRAPFRGASVYDTLHQVRYQEPVAPSQLAPKLPRDIETICLKCLQKEPAKRYQTALALADDLGRFSDGTPILARPVGSAERLWRWCRRNPRIAALSAAVVALLVVWGLSSSLLAARLANEKQATAHAAALALANAQRANANADEARRSAAAADASAWEARKQAKLVEEQKALVERNETSARTVAQIALDRLVRIGGMVRKRLPSASDETPAGRQVLRLRQELDALLKQTVAEIAQNTGVRRSDPERLAAVLQQLGDLQVKLGQGEDASKQFQRAFELLENHAREHPDDDRAQANVGTMLIRLGDTAQQLNGDSVSALPYFTRAWDIQQSIMLHPRSGFYSALDHTRLLSHYALKRGIARLRMGDPIEAARWVGESVKRRREWVGTEPDSAPAVSYLAEALMWGATAARHTGDPTAAEKQFAEALGIYAKLRERFPRSGEFLGDQATIAAAHADALLRGGARDEARKEYELARRDVEVVLAHDADDAEKRALRATLLEGLAAVALGESKPAEAERYYRDALVVREDLARLEPQNLPASAARALAVAHCGRIDEAAQRAAVLVRTVPDRVELVVSAARVSAACAERAQAAERRRYVEAALDSLKAATAKGYRDAFVLQTDPDLRAVRDDERFTKIILGIARP